MKYGMLVHDMAISGGYQKLVLRLSREFIKLGHQVIIYTVVVDREKCYPDQINQFNVVALREESRPGTIWTDYADYRQLARQMDPELDGLVIHDESSVQVLNIYRSRKANAQAVWMLNNQLNPNILLSPGLGFLRGVGPRTLLSRLWLWPQLYYKAWILRRCMRRLDAFATYDKFNQQLVRRSLGREATVVFAGADLEDFERVGAKKRSPKNTPLRVLSVGVSLPHRRYEDLIRAVTLAGSEVKLTIVGRSDINPEYNKMLRDLAHTQGVADAVEFIDYVTDEAMYALYEEADVFAFVNDAETWGIAVFEAVAAQLPVIITSNIGASDLIRDGKEGWVVESRSPEQIAKALREISQKPAVARQRADQAWGSVSKIVSWSAYAQRMLKLLKAPVS